MSNYIPDTAEIGHYQVSDETWRVTAYPFNDKIRNIKTEEEALAIVDKIREFGWFEYLEGIHE
jgi:hypothetical protein